MLTIPDRHHSFLCFFSSTDELSTPNQTYLYVVAILVLIIFSLCYMPPISVMTSSWAETLSISSLPAQSPSRLL